MGEGGKQGNIIKESLRRDIRRIKNGDPKALAGYIKRFHHDALLIIKHDPFSDKIPYQKQQARKTLLQQIRLQKKIHIFDIFNRSHDQIIKRKNILILAQTALFIKYFLNIRAKSMIKK